jgi:UPF0271 protein
VRRGSIDLNADVGEGCGFDEELIPLVSSVNIACGAHAGGREAMQAAVTLAVRHGAAIGAHPGFADRENFGRKEIPISPVAASALVIGQLRVLAEVAGEAGARVGHVKLHGALYNMAARGGALARAICEAIGAENRRGQERTLVALAGSGMASVADALGLCVAREAFADRLYLGDGSLAPRSREGSVIEDPGHAAMQALGIVREGRVLDEAGSAVAVDADTICIHGDRPGGAALALRIRQELAASGIAIRRFGAGAA